MPLRRVLILIALWLSVAGAKAAPANDRFTNALELVGIPVVTTGNNTDATFDAGGPNTGLGGRSIWWRWTAPLTGRVVIVSEDGWVNLWCTVWTGSTLTNLSLQGANQLYYGLFLSVTQGVTYYIALDDGQAGAPAGDVQFRIDTPPPNDDFANATEVFGQNWEVSADNRYATEEDEFFLAGWRIGTVWWKWTAPFSGPARLSVSGSEGEIYVWMGTGSLTNLQVLQGEVQAGVTYWICAATAHGRGRIKLRVWPPKPPNDQYVDRFVITNLPTRLFASNIGASNEAYEPKVSGRPQPASVWWKLVAPISGRLIINATPDGNEWWNSLDVAVYTGRQFRRLKLLAANNREVSLPVKAGLVYDIAVSGGTDTRTDFVLEARVVPPPSNDAFENRQPLTGARVKAWGDNTGATSQSGEPRLPVSPSGASVWYSWTAPADGWCVMNVGSSNNASAGLTVCTGKAVGGLKRVAVPTDPNWTTVGFAARKGATYEILVDAYGNQRGTFELNVLLTTVRIVTPAPGSLVSGAEPLAISIAADPTIDVGVTNMTLLADRGGWDSRILGEASSLVSAFLATNLPSGEVTLRVRLGLADGQTVSAPAVGVTIRPANDDFAHAFIAQGYEWSADVPFAASSPEREEPSHVPGWKRVPSLWWLWTAPSSGEALVSIHTYGRNRIGLNIYTGAELNSLSPVIGRVDVDPVEGVGRITFQAERGVTYRFAVVTDQASARRGFIGSIHCLLKASAVIATSPIDVTGPASLSFALVTSEATEQIASVDFLANGIPVATLTAPPFAYTLSNVTCGIFDISARINKISGEPPPLVEAVRFWVRPSNDHFTNRMVIHGVSNALVQCISSATFDPGEPVHVGLWPQSSVWWSWTAPASGRLYIGEPYPPYPEFPYPYVALYTGDVLTNLTLVVNSAPERSYPDRIVQHVESGITYEIATGGEELNLRLRFYPPPANDHFSNSTTLAGTNAWLTGHTVGATRESGEPAHDGRLDVNTVWWNWTAPTNGYIVVNPEGPLSVGIYEGTHVAALVARPRLAMGEVLVEAGHTYSIVLISYWGDTESVSAQLHFTPTVDHDWFVSAIHLSGTNEVLVADNRGATREPNEASLEKGVGQSLWWTWTAPAQGNAYLTAERVIGTAPVFGIFEDASPAARAPLAMGDFYSSAEFRASAGHTYAILVDSTGGISPAVLHLRLVPAPENDAFADATELIGLPVLAIGMVRGASLEPGEPLLHSFLEGASVWYRWQCPATTNVLVTAPSHVVGAFTGQNLLGLTRVLPQTHDDTVHFSATAGTIYWIKVTQMGGLETDVNDPDFELRVRPFRPAANDFFANASVLEGLSGSRSDENWLATLEQGEYWAAWEHLKRTLWYAWQAPGGGLFVVTNSATDASFSMFSFLGGDWRSLMVIGGSFNGATTPVRPGDVVHLVADRLYGEGGSLTFGYQFVPAPANDEETNAFELVGSSVTFGGDVYTATGESTVLVDRNRFDYRDVWWRWTAPSAGAVAITNIAVSGLPGIRVYTGSGSARVLVAHNYVGLDDRATTFNATSGVTYTIAVSWSLGGDQVLLKLMSDAPFSPVGAFVPAAQVSFTVPVLGRPGTPFIIDASTNLVDWEPIFSDTLKESRFDYPVRETPLPQRFFRIRLTTPP